MSTILHKQHLGTIPKAPQHHTSVHSTHTAHRRRSHFHHHHSSADLDSDPHIHKMSINSPYIATKHASTKIACLILGLIVTFASYFAYSDSPWHSEQLALECIVSRKFYGHLKWDPIGNVTFDMFTTYCPSLIMERFFVYSNLVIFILSTILFVYCCKTDPYILNELRKRDATYHGTAGVVLLVGAVLQVVSNFGISSNKCLVFQHLKSPVADPANQDLCAQYLLIDRKYIAAALGFLEVILYGVCGCVIDRVKLHGLTIQRRGSGGDALRNSGNSGMQPRMSIRPSTGLGSSPLSSRHRPTRRKSTESYLTLDHPTPSIELPPKNPNPGTATPP